MRYAIRWFKCKLKPPKNSSSWEIRRVTSTLLVDPQIDFVRTVKQMDMKLGGDPSKSPVNTF